MNSLIAQLETLRPLSSNFHCTTTDTTVSLLATTPRQAQFDFHYDFSTCKLQTCGIKNFFLPVIDIQLFTPRRLRLLFDIADFLPCTYRDLQYKLEALIREICVTHYQLFQLESWFICLIREQIEKLEVPTLLALCYRQHPQLVRRSLPTHPALQDYVFTLARTKYLRRRYGWCLAQGVLLKAIATPGQVARMMVPVLRKLVELLPREKIIIREVHDRHTQIPAALGLERDAAGQYLVYYGADSNAIWQMSKLTLLFHSPHIWRFYLFLRQLVQQYEF